MLNQRSPAHLLTTRRRSAIALALTAFVLTQAIRGLNGHHAQSQWLFTPLLHGWILVAINVFFYAYLCWIGFWFVRGTEGRERLFMLGWFTGVLLLPLRIVRPEWAEAVKLVGVLSLSASILVALALLLEPSKATVARSSPTDAT